MILNNSIISSAAGGLHRRKRPTDTRQAKPEPKTRREEVVAKMYAILDRCDADGKRALTPEEVAEYDKLEAELDQIEGKQAATSTGRKTGANASQPKLTLRGWFQGNGPKRMEG